MMYFLFHTTCSNPDLSRGTSGSDTHESDLYSADCDLPQGFFAAFYHMLHDALCGPCADGKVRACDGVCLVCAFIYFAREVGTITRC